jgi:hypothetical protein
MADSPRGGFPDVAAGGNADFYCLFPAGIDSGASPNR